MFLNETLFLIEMFYWGNDYLRLWNEKLYGQT